MNLENLYGTQESLLKVFERALQQNEPKKMFFQLAGIYARTNKMEVGNPLLSNSRALVLCGYIPQ